MNRCHECQGERLSRIDDEHRVEIGAVTFVATVPGLRCEDCGEVTVAGPDLEAAELNIAGALARHGEASPEAFRFMRRALGMRAADLARWLGVTPETVSRWENNRQPIDRGAAALLAAIVVDRLEGRTSTIDRLDALLHPEPLPRVVRLDPRSAIVGD